jgi:putative aldouronate transport system permease protein
MMVLLFVFSVVPMFGIIIALQKFLPATGVFGSKLVGLTNIQNLFMFPNVGQVLRCGTRGSPSSLLIFDKGNTA